MKKILVFVLTTIFATQLWSQNVSSSKEDRNFRIPLIGEKAPSFIAESTNGEINFPDDFGLKWKKNHSAF
jgi:peroxiredoxin (alkyl hydroperoxide reductase subunit C)